MAAVTTVRDVLCHYSFVRSLYDRFIGDYNCNPQVAQNAVALLLCFDRRTNNQLIAQLLGMTTAALGHLLAEASFVIRCFRRRDLPARPMMPLISALCQDSRRMDDPHFFRVNRDLIVRSVADILDGVGRLIFDDHLFHLLRRHQTGLVGRNPEPELEALKAPYVGAVTVPEDCRAMFVTFGMGMGQAVERDEIFNYFRETWGDCIVRVLIGKTTRGAQPKYGRVIFKSKAFVSLLLHGDENALIVIRGREIKLREYTPSRSLNN